MPEQAEFMVDFERRQVGATTAAFRTARITVTGQNLPPLLSGDRWAYYQRPPPLPPVVVGRL